MKQWDDCLNAPGDFCMTSIPNIDCTDYERRFFDHSLYMYVRYCIRSWSVIEWKGFCYSTDYRKVIANDIWSSIVFQNEIWVVILKYSIL